MNVENRVSESKLKKVGRYAVVNAAFAVLAYLGFYDGLPDVATAFNVIVTAMTGMLAILSVVIVVLHKNTTFRQNMTEKNCTAGGIAAVPKYVDIVYDMAMIAFLAKFAPLYSLGMYCAMCFFQTFMVEYIEKNIFIKTTPLFNNMDTEDEDRDELIRLGVLDSERR